MKALKRKLTGTEFSRQTEIRFNYKKFLKSHVFERRKQLNIHNKLKNL